jgi:hypothetical protein
VEGEEETGIVTILLSTVMTVKIIKTDNSVRLRTSNLLTCTVRPGPA